MCKGTHPLQYYKLKPAIILNDTIETPRKMKLMFFQKKIHKQHIHLHTHSLTACCLTQHYLEDFLHPFVFKNKSQLAL